MGKLSKAVWIVLEQEVDDGDIENGPDPNGPSIYYTPVHSSASHRKAQRWAAKNKLRFFKIDCLRKADVGNAEWHFDMRRA